MRGNLMEVELNLMPFYALALSESMIIRRDIDKLYLKNKEKYYSAAKNNNFYDCLMGKENSLLTEEYFKKCLGFLVYVDEEGDEETAKEVFNLFKKAYKKTYLYCKNSGYKDMDFKRYIIDMNSYLSKLDDDAFNGNIIAVYFFTNCKCKNIEYFHDSLYAIQEHHNDYRRISLDNMSDDREKEINRYLKTVPNNILDEILSSKRKMSGYDYIYDIEKLSSLSIFRELNFNKRDIKEIIMAYLCAIELNESENIDFDNYVISALHIKAMCKAYNAVKKMYFENNKETLYLDMSSLKEELFKTKSDLRLADEKYKQLTENEKIKEKEFSDENRKLKNEIRELQTQINKMQSDSQEVVSLREYFFRQEQGVDITDKNDIDIGEINNAKGIIIGGHPNWQNKIKEKLPGWKIIAAEVNTLNDAIIRSCDVLVFNTGHLNHSLYYKLIKSIKEHEIRIGYISSTNVDKSIAEIKIIMQQDLT